MSIKGKFIAGMLLFIALLVSCGGDSGGDGNGPRGVEGVFTIAGQSTHGNIEVSIYSTSIIENSLRDLKARFPLNGPELSNALRFNHREYSPLATTTTNANGEWDFSGIDRTSSYILVAENDDIGFAYFFDVQGEADINEELNPRATLTGNIFSDNLVYNNQVIDVVGDVFVANAAQMNLSGHCIFQFDGSNTLTIRSNFTMAAGSRLTLLNKGTGVAELEFENVSGVDIINLSVLEPVKLIMNNTVFSITEGLLLGGTFDGLRMIDGRGDLRNVLFYNQLVGISASQVDSLSGNRLIFSGGQQDVTVSNSGMAVFRDNLFHNGNQNLEFISTSGIIANNRFEGSSNNIVIADISTVDVRNNHFQSNTNNLHLQQISHGQQEVFVDLNFNNFIGTQDLAVRLDNGTVPDSLNAINNFWGTTVEPEIQDIIYDKTDNPQGSNSLKYVKFKPFELQAVSAAGIR